MVRGVLAGAMVLGAVSSLSATDAPKNDLNHAWEAFRLRDFPVAEKNFRAALASGGGAEALYGLATTTAWRSDRQEDAEAQKLFRELQKTYPESPWAAWSRLDAIRLRHLTNPTEPPPAPELARAYGELADHPAASLADLYRYVIMLSYVTPDEATRLCGEIEARIAAQPDNPFQLRFYDVLARMAELADEPEVRLRALLKASGLLEVRIGEGQGASLTELADTYWQVAVTADFDVGDFPTALKYYGLFLETAPSDQRAFTVIRLRDQLQGALGGGDE